MKKIVSETIDGSIKDIIQLKTLDASLEYSQMFDALDDCPQEFQGKLMGALNSLGETMQIPPTEAFNKVLCKSDEDEDVKKKLYNWWRAVFEVLSRCQIPDDRVDEYNQKVDNLMAEILKAGDAEATDEEEPVMESTKPRFEKGRVVFTKKGGHRCMVVKCGKEDGRYFYTVAWMGSEPGFDEFWEDELCLKSELTMENYEQASKEDEDKMLDNMEFAIQHIGEIANKVQALINFINPYCGMEVNESMTTGKPKFKKGDIVRLVGNSPIGRGMHGRIVDIELDYPDWGYTVDGRSGLFFADEEDLELVKSQYDEENNFMKKPARYSVGDKVKVVGRGLASKGWIGVVSSVDKSSPGLPYTVDFAGRESGEYAPEELAPAKGFTEEENSKMKKIAKERGEADEWLSEKDIIGMKVSGESGNDEGETEHLSPEEMLDTALDIKPDDMFEVYDGGLRSKTGEVVLSVLVHKSTVSWEDVNQKFGVIARQYGWKLAGTQYISGDEADMIDGDNCAIKVVFAPATQQANEENLENELKKGDDGWTTIGQPVSEAKVVVDANTVWDVLDLLDDTDANNNLTDLINSHVRTEDEIMDAIDTACGDEDVSKKELNKLMTKHFLWILDALGLDVERFKETGEFVEKGKPTSVELESDWDEKPREREEAHDKPKHGEEAIVNGQKVPADSGYAEFMRIANMEPRKRHWEESTEGGKTKKVTLYVDWDDDGAGLDNNVVIDVPAEIADSEDTDALYDYVSDWIDHQEFCVNDWMITDIEGLMDEGSEEVKKPEEVKSQDKTFNQDGENKTLVTGEDKKKEMSDKEAATIMGGASETDMDAADIGVSSHEVADPYKKPVCEMTIEQEVDNPWNLAEMLWGQGKENLEELLRSELVGEEDIMMMLEDSELRNLTSINDAFAFDFPSILDSLGLDGEAWSQNLEIKRKDDDSED